MRVLRWSVPIDDKTHSIGAGQVAHVAVKSSHHGPATSVEVWTIEPDEDSGLRRAAQVYGTGHLVPDHCVFIGSALDLGGALVWHVFIDLLEDPSPIGGAGVAPN